MMFFVDKSVVDEESILQLLIHNMYFSICMEFLKTIQKITFNSHKFI